MSQHENKKCQTIDPQTGACTLRCPHPSTNLIINLIRPIISYSSIVIILCFALYCRPSVLFCIHSWNATTRWWTPTRVHPSSCSVLLLAVLWSSVNTGAQLSASNIDCWTSIVQQVTIPYCVVVVSVCTAISWRRDVEEIVDRNGP